MGNFLMVGPVRDTHGTRETLIKNFKGLSNVVKGSRVPVNMKDGILGVV
jgi:hypothetical protein